MIILIRALAIVTLLSLSAHAFGNPQIETSITINLDTEMLGIQDNADLVIFTPYCEYEGDIFAGDMDEFWLGIAASIAF